MTPTRRSQLKIVCAALFAVLSASAQVPAATLQFTDSVTPPERLISPHVADMLAETLPNHLPPQTTAVPTVGRSDGQDPNDVVQMPTFLVREPKLPSPAEVTWKDGTFSFSGGGTLLANRGKIMTSAVKFKYNPDHHGRLNPGDGGFDLLSFSR